MASTKRAFVEEKGRGKKKREEQDNAQLRREDESVKSAGITGERFDPVFRVTVSHRHIEWMIESRFTERADYACK